MWGNPGICRNSRSTATWPLCYFLRIWSHPKGHVHFKKHLFWKKKVPGAHTLGAPPPDPRYQSASGLPSYALAPDVRKASKKSFFLDILAPGRAMLHPDGLLGKRSFFWKTKTPLRGDAVHRTACFYQVLIDIWSIVPFVGLFIHI